MTKQEQKIEVVAALRAELAKRLPDLIVADPGDHPNLIRLNGGQIYSDGDAISIDEKVSGGYGRSWIAKGSGQYYLSLQDTPYRRRTMFNRKKTGEWDYDAIAEFLTNAVSEEAKRQVALEVERQARRATNSLEERLELSKIEEDLIRLQPVATDPGMFRITFKKDMAEADILRFLGVIRDGGFVN